MTWESRVIVIRTPALSTTVVIGAGPRSQPVAMHRSPALQERTRWLGYDLPAGMADLPVSMSTVYSGIPNPSVLVQTLPRPLPPSDTPASDRSAPSPPRARAPASRDGASRVREERVESHIASAISRVPRPSSPSSRPRIVRSFGSTLGCRMTAVRWVTRTRNPISSQAGAGNPSSRQVAIIRCTPLPHCSTSPSSWKTRPSTRFRTFDTTNATASSMACTGCMSSRVWSRMVRFRVRFRDRPLVKGLADREPLHLGDELRVGLAVGGAYAHVGAASAPCRLDEMGPGCARVDLLETEFGV